MEKITKFIDKIDRHDVFIMSAALAYTTSLALAPFMLIILSLLSFLNFDMQEKFTTQIGYALGPEVQSVVDAIVKNLQNHSQLSEISGVIGFVVLLISASAIFSNLQIAIDKINEYKVPENRMGFSYYLKNKFLSLGLVLGFAFLSIVSLLVTTFITMLYPSNEVLFWQAVAQIVNFLLFAFLFTAIYHFVPTERLIWKKSVFAGMISTLFFLLGKSMISSYLAGAGLGSMYGVAGSLVVFLAWVYYTSLMILLSYEISLEVFSIGKIATRLSS
jgi:membrane protein